MSQSFFLFFLNFEININGNILMIKVELLFSKNDEPYKNTFNYFVIIKNKDKGNL